MRFHALNFRVIFSEQNSHSQHANLPNTALIVWIPKITRSEKGDNEGTSTSLFSLLIYTSP
jgi:hypothetical protein